MKTTLADHAVRLPPIASHELRRCDSGRPSRLSVLHLMNAIADSSITSIAVDQIKQFGDQDFEWHVGGLGGVDPDEPFSDLGANVVDFSDRAGGPMQLASAVRAYVKQHRIGIVHTHTPRTTVIASLALGTRRPAKLVATKHLHAVSQERANWGWLFKSVDRCAVYFPDQIIAVSNDVGDQIRSLPGVRSDRVQVIQNAVDIEAYDAHDQRSQCRAEFGIPSGAPLLGFAGRIAKQKRVDLLLEAFAEVSNHHPQVHLLIAGEGEESEQQQAYARELGVNDRVVWAGYRRDMPRLLAAMDIYVQSSVNEGLSLSLLQAMAARRPVVATDVGGTREVVNQETGLLIPSGSSEPLASSILDILEDPARAARRVDKAWHLVNERFSVTKQMEQYRTVYERLCEV